MKKFFTRVAIGGAIGYTLAAGYVLMGNPGMALEGRFSRTAFMAPEFSLSRGMSEAAAEEYQPHMTLDGTRILGFEGAPVGTPLSQVAVVLPSHDKNALDKFPLGEKLRRMGFHVYIVAYPPARTGLSSDKHEEAALEQIRVQLDYVSKRYSDFPVTVIGETLGASIGAKALAVYGLTVNHFVLVSPWTSLSEVANDKGSALPLSFGLGKQFELLPFLKNYRGHITFVATGADAAVPESHVNELSYQLFGGRHDAIWWAEQGNSGNWISQFTDRQLRAMLVNFDHLPPLVEESPAEGHSN